MHLGIWEVQGNKNGILTKLLKMKKLAKQSHLPLTIKLVVLMVFQWNSAKALISGKDDLEESSENNRNVSSGFKCLKAIINRIWNGDFQKSWNKALIVSIHKKGDLSNCNNYRVISLIINGLKIIVKIKVNRLSKYGINK